MSELEQAFNEVMGQLGDTESAWRTMLAAAVKRLNQFAQDTAAQPPSKSPLAQLQNRMNTVQRAKFLTTWQPFRAGDVNAQSQRVSMRVRGGSADVQMLGGHKEVDQTVKATIMAEMTANPKVWLEPQLRQRLKHGRPAN